MEKQLAQLAVVCDFYGFVCLQTVLSDLSRSVTPSRMSGGLRTVDFKNK